VLIENEFGEIGIDGGFLKDAGVEITEMNSGCICCSLVGDFGRALQKVLVDFTPDRIIIEPSGVGKLSDVIRAVKDAGGDAVLNGFTTVVDAKKCRMYMKNFGEFFNDQVENAGTIVLSHTAQLSDHKLEECVDLLREHNKDAVIVTTDWNELNGKTLLSAIEREDTLEAQLRLLHDEEVCPECGGHHHDHNHEDGECCCHERHHEHYHDDHCECGCHDHGHYDHGECDCGCHEHHHDHDEECNCGCHDHEHHHHHHADEVFTSWGKETTAGFTTEFIKNALEALLDDEKYGVVLRAKGIVPCVDGGWIHFDYVPGEPDVRKGSAGVIGRLCVIGSKLNENSLSELFGI